MKQIVAAEEIEDVTGLQRVERWTRERAERRRRARQIRQSVGVREAPAAVRRRVRDVEAAAARGFADALPLDGCVDAASQRDDQAHGDPPDRFRSVTHAAPRAVSPATRAAGSTSGGVARSRHATAPPGTTGPSPPAPAR